MRPPPSGLRSELVARGGSRFRWLLLGLPLANGAGLVVHILAGIDMRLAVGALLLGGLVTWAVLVPKLPLALRLRLRRRAAVGAISGAIATLAATVNVRPTSSQGSPTVEIQRPGQPSIKIRYQ